MNIEERSERYTVAGCEDEKGGLCAKECGHLLEVGKSKETDFPLEIPENNATLPAPLFQPSRTGFGLLTYRTKIINL